MRGVLMGKDKKRCMYMFLQHFLEVNTLSFYLAFKSLSSLFSVTVAAAA